MTGRWLISTVAFAVLLCVCMAAVAAVAAVADDASDDASAEQSTGSAFGYSQVVDKAKALADKSYDSRDKVPKFLREMDAGELDQIKFNQAKALWRIDKIPYEVQFYHPGSFYVYPVKINVVTDDGVDAIPFSTDYFKYPKDKLKDKIPSDLGFAGVKVLHHLNSEDHLDEVVSFLGASYFRALPAKAHYGLSARGLAIDTASNGGEEFPAFTEFWLVRPQPDDEQLTVYALLDSPSLAGAYKFVIDPGATTTMEVSSTLFPRADIEKLGVAPLTSMFAWGENSLHRLDYERPEAHDSDGLLMHNNNGEWLWRPLKNPQDLTINQFVSENVRGFGLLQRDRNFSHYQQFDYEYELRPGLWVVPKGDWGAGEVELVQIPSDSEVNDNIAVYWVPDKTIKAGEKQQFDYTLKWLMHEPDKHEQGTARSSRIGYAAIVPGEKRDRIKVSIEFTGGKLQQLHDADEVEPRVSPERDVTLSNIQAVPNPHTKGWRLSFLVPISALKKPLELRAYLESTDGQALTETWTYTLTQ